MSRIRPAVHRSCRPRRLLLAILLIAPAGLGVGCSGPNGLNPNFNRFNQRVERVAQATRDDAMRCAAFLRTLTPERIGEELEDAGREVVAVAAGAHQWAQQDVINSRRRFRARVDRAIAYETRIYERAPETMRDRLRILVE